LKTARRKDTINSQSLPDGLNGRKEVMSLLFAKENGQGLLEYGLILVLVAVVVIAAITVLGPVIGNLFTKVNSSIPNP
jgi:pilus assembly protein Flp/PilA